MAVRQEGRRQFTPAFIFTVRRRTVAASAVPASLPRLGIVAPRRVGPAVVRNLLKRRMRELFRAHQALFPPEADVVVVLQPKAVEADFTELERLFLGAVRRAGFGVDSGPEARPEGAEKSVSGLPPASATGGPPGATGG